MKFPLLKALLFYIAGLVAAYLWAPPPAWLFASTALVLALSMGVPDQRWALIPLLLALAGWTNLTARQAVWSPYDLRVLASPQPELATLRGRLVETPYERLYEFGARPKFRTIACVEVESILRDSDWQPACGQVVVSTPGILSAVYFGGQGVEVSGVLQSPRRSAAEGLFDYRAYLRWLGIHHQLVAQSTNDWVLAGPALPIRPLTDRFCDWATGVLAAGLPEADEPYRLIRALTLGWKTALTSQVTAPFIQTGTMHVFAISGLHIALIAGVLIQLLRVLRIPRPAAGALSIPLLWFYTAASGWQSPAIRSALMMTVVIGGWALRRPGNLLNSLASAGLIILAWDPSQLFQASFQLSFFVVLSLALFCPPLQQWVTAWLQPDPLLPPLLVPKWRQGGLAVIRAVLFSLATTMAAWLGSLPLIAYYFHMVTPVNLPANLLIVPLSSLTLVANAGALACAGWAPYLTSLFNHTGWLSMRLMIDLSHWMANWPGAWFHVRTPTPGEFAWFYCAVFGLVLPARFSARTRLAGGLVLGLSLLVWAGNVLWGGCPAKIMVLAAGGGDAIWADLPGRDSDLLIDGGSKRGAETTRSALAAQGWNRINRLLATHGDASHVGGADGLLDYYKIRELLTGPGRPRSTVWRNLVDGRAALGGSIRVVQRGDWIGCWQVLHPPNGIRLAAADDQAVVLRASVQGLVVLLCSDLGPEGQQEVLSSGLEVAADVVVSGIPVKGQPLGEDFLAAVRPSLIILSTAQFPSQEQAKAPLRRRLERRGIPVVYTSDAGSVTLGMKAGRWWLMDAYVQRLLQGGNQQKQPTPEAEPD